MGELSQHLNPVPETVRRIEKYHKQRGDSEPRRGYLGASIIGHECDRYLWYTFRGCVPRDFSGRLYRLFETGNLAESRFIAELRAIGCTVHDLDPETGKQFEVMALGGHFSGHMDGCALGIAEAPKTWHVCEFKTHAKKYFAKLEKNGVRAFPMHYAQMQVYMGLTRMTRAMYLAVNKDTDHLHAERIHFVAADFKNLMERAGRIIRSNAPPERGMGRSDDYRCKFCDARDLCWGDIEEAAVPIPRRNCRSCCHATPEIDPGETWARWSCARTGGDLTPSGQDQGCDGHLLLPGLIWFADSVDAGQDWIEFENHSDRAHWRHGYGDGLWSTAELMASPAVAVGNKDVEAVKTALGGTCERTPLVDRYAPGDSERLWDGPPDGINTALENLGLDGLRNRIPTRIESADDGALATEFAGKDGENDILIVVYRTDNVAAIWKGKT